MLRLLLHLGATLLVLWGITHIPTTAAVDEWFPFMDTPKLKISLWDAAIPLFTSAAVATYLRNFLRARTKEEGHSGSNHTVESFIRAIWSRSYMKNPIGDENLFEYANTLLEDFSRIVENNTGAAGADDLARASAVAVRALKELGDQLTTAAAQTDKLIQDKQELEQKYAHLEQTLAFGAPASEKAQELEALERALQDTFPHWTDLTPIAVKWELQSLKAKADWTPFFALTPWTASERDKIKTTSQLASGLQDVYYSELNALYQMIPEQFKAAGETLQEQFTHAMQQLRNSLNRMTKRISGLPMDTDCNHPRELADTMGYDPTPPWQELLGYVSALLHPALGPAPSSTSDRVFRATDVPEFRSADQYWTWRAMFKRFAQAESVADHMVNTAIARVLARFTDSAALVARSWDINQLTAPTWAQTINTFLSYADMRFLSPDFFEQQMKKWRGLRPKAGQDALEFLREFEAEFLTLNEAGKVVSRLPISDGEMVRQCIAVLPRDVRTQLKFRHENPDLMAPRDFFNATVKVWNFVTEENKIRNPAPRQPAPAAARAVGSPFTLPCTKPCWETSPRIPDNMRGKVRDNNGNVLPQYKNICFGCRRTPEEHGGTCVGCPIKGDHSIHGSTPARNASGNAAGEQ